MISNGMVEESRSSSGTFNAWWIVVVYMKGNRESGHLVGEEMESAIGFWQDNDGTPAV
jgi:hypothetical protein